MSFRHLTISLLAAAVFFTSCGNSINRIFTHRTPHEAYGHKIEHTLSGQQWVLASTTSLQHPQAVDLPYRQIGYFPLDKPRSLSLLFKARQGERISFRLTRKNAKDFVIYADLFEQDVATPRHLVAADTTDTLFSIDIAQTASYLLRLQPELARTGYYELLIESGPSIAFPVAGKKAKAGSFWGDARDAGARKHEGIDIFAPKRTPAIAAAAGYVTRVADGGIGGKTIWLRPEGKSYHLYYAHLDSQLVSEGDFVQQFDTLGLVGNTGNARLTPSHLHFGVYDFRGAIDPLPFVKPGNKVAGPVEPVALNKIKMLFRSRKDKANDSLVVPGAPLVPLAATEENYLVEDAGGRLFQVPRPLLRDFDSTISADLRKHASRTSRG